MRRLKEGGDPVRLFDSNKQAQTLSFLSHQPSERVNETEGRHLHEFMQLVDYMEEQRSALV